MASIRKRGKYDGAQFRLPAGNGEWRLASVRTKTADANEARRFSNNAEQMALKARAVAKTHGLEYCEILLSAIRDAGASRLTPDANSPTSIWLGKPSRLSRRRSDTKAKRSFYPCTRVCWKRSMDCSVTRPQRPAIGSLPH